MATGNAHKPAATQTTLSAADLVRFASVDALPQSWGHPNKFTFARNAEALFFLASGQAYEQSLYYVLIPEGPSGGPLMWQKLCNAADLMDSARKLSKEEELLRERQRSVDHGITGYSYDEKGHRLLIPAGSNLYVVSDLNLKERKWTTTEVPTPVKNAVRMDAKLSADGSVVSFVRSNDLWLCDLKTGTEHRLTTAGAQDGIMCGVAEFVQQEEFNRFTGYYWGPSETSFSILYEEVDETGVAKYNIPEPGHEGTVETARYPLAGKANAKVQIKIATYDRATGVRAAFYALLITFQTVSNLALAPSLKERFPDMEYLVRFGWHPDSKSIWVQTIDRVQQTLRFTSIGVDQFVPQGVVNGTSKQQTILMETTTYWINVNDVSYFLKDGRIIWSSERTGFRHLYLLTPSALGYTTTAITQGDGWQVDEEDIFVDEAAHLVYFMGTKDTPLESHLYVASFAAPGNGVHRLSHHGFTHHEAAVAPLKDSALFVTKFTNIHKPPSCSLHNVFLHANLASAPMVEVVAPLQDQSRTRTNLPFPVPPPEIFHFNASCGEVLYGAVWLPVNFDPKKKYPAVVHVYGGPHVQRVTNDYMMMVAYKLRTYVLNALGFVVICGDNRGSYRRGLKFEGMLREKMGTVECVDQVEILQHVIAKGFVDPARVAVEGWSYGGFMSLNLLADYGHVFKIAIAGGPVTDWKAYDTAYTERYMNTPEANPNGYKDGSPITKAAKFPDEEGRVVLVHGLIDENGTAYPYTFHFCNTSMLIDALTDKNKPYLLWLYPSERHGIRSHKNTLHLDTRFVQFLVKHL